MYDSRDDKSFTRACNYRPARRYRPFFPRRYLAEHRAKKVNNRESRHLCTRTARDFCQVAGRSVCRPIKVLERDSRGRIIREGWRRDYASRSKGSATKKRVHGINDMGVTGGRKVQQAIIVVAS